MMSGVFPIPIGEKSTAVRIVPLPKIHDQYEEVSIFMLKFL